MYLILPANSSYSRYPDNTNQNFKVHFPKRLHLDGGLWEIALCKISFNNNWYNMKGAFIELMNTVTHAKTRVKIKDGKYKSVETVLDEVHRSLDFMDCSRIIRFLHDQARDKMYLLFLDGLYKVRFSPDLAAVLGFSSWKIYSRPDDVSSLEAPSIPDIDAGYDTMYVYCSLCENRFVGDSLVPYLYNVPINPDSHNSTIVHHEVQRPMYVPAVNIDTDEVEIDIRRGDGEPVLFRGGCVIVTVHLRLKKKRI